MKLHLEGESSAHRITSYGPGYIVINGVRYTRSLIVTPDQIEPNWSPSRFDEITPDHVARLAGPGTEIALLGTGTHQRFPDARLLAPLIGRQIPLEVMSTDAACRTFNILAGDGRLVAAALLMID